MSLLLLTVIFQSAAGMAPQEPEVQKDEGPKILAAHRDLVNKTLYMYRVADAVSIGEKTTKEIFNTTYPTGQGNKTDPSQFKIIVDWYLFPVLAGDLNLNGTSSLTVWVKADVADTKDMTYTLTEIDSEGTETVISSATESRAISNAWSKSTIGLNIDNYTVSKGSTLKITYLLWGDAFHDYEVAYGGTVDTGIRDSNVTLPCRNYISVDSVYTEDYNGNVTAFFLPDTLNKTVYIRANVTNPFGGYDTPWVNLTLRDPSGAVVTENMTMTKTYGFFNSFESRFIVVWNYTGQPEGTYNVTVRAVDNNGLRAWNLSGGTDFGGHEVYGYHEFIIGGLDNYINFRVTDDHGQNLTDTKLIVGILGTTFSWNYTDASGITNISLGNFTYSLSVIWQDVGVSVNTTIDVGVIGNRTYGEPYNITADVYYPTIRVLDSAGSPVEQANVYVTHPNGTTEITPLKTNESGEINFMQTAEGTYNLQIYWKGRVVGNINQLMDSSTVFDAYVDIFYLWVTVQDQAGGAVSNALVVFSYNDNGLVADSLLTAQNGSVYSRLPGAEYRIVVYWSDARVYDGIYNLNASASITVTAGIYEVDVTVLDSSGTPLKGAEVTAIFNSTGRQMDTGTTDSNGQVFFQLAEGEHRFDVRWLGEDIASNITYIDSTNTSVVIYTAVYQLQIKALDGTADANPLANATVSVIMDGEVVDSGTTNQTGIYVSKLPAADVDIMISWKGIPVYHETDITVSGNDIHEAVCDVYYLNVTVIDSGNVAVEGAGLEVLYGGGLIASGVSDAAGTEVLRLPVESYTVVATWMGVVVASVDYDMVDLQGGNSLTIVCDIYYLTMNVEDAMGDAVSGATINVKLNGDSLLSVPGGDDGTATVRLPKENYTLIVVWRGFVVNETTVNVDANKTVELVAAIYHVTFTALDSRGIAIHNAKVTASHNGEAYASGWTDADGAYPVLIPQGEFLITAEWYGINVYDANHDIVENGELQLPCAVYYLTVDGRDSKNMTVSGLDISVYHSELPEGQNLLATATVDDYVTVRVPTGTIDILGEWKGFPVADDSVDVTADTNFTLECSVFYLNVTVEDSEGETLDGADLVVRDTDGVAFVTHLTEQGAAVPRLPEGEWTFVAFWQGQEVGSATTDLDETTTKEITITTAVHYIRLLVQGKGEAVPGVELSLLDSSGGAIMTQTTDSEGKATFSQVAQGDYQIIASLKKTQMLTNVDLKEYENVTLTASQDLTIDFEGYPLSFFSTNLFLSILLFTVVAALGGYLIYNKNKNKGQAEEDFEDEASQEPENDTADEPENDTVDEAEKGPADEGPEFETTDESEEVI